LDNNDNELVFSDFGIVFTQNKKCGGNW